MDLALTLAPGHEFLRIFINGALVAEVAVGVTQVATSLAAEVARARVLERLAWAVQEWRSHVLMAGDLYDHREKTPAACLEAYGQGHKAGLCGRTVPHPFPGVPALPPDHTKAYRLGYEDGATLARCLALLGEARA